MTALVRTDNRRMLVTGAHRSGTTIATRILADELGLEFDTESRIRDRRGRFLVTDVCERLLQSGVCVHGASCFNYLTTIAAAVSGLAIVFVWRRPVDVRVSQERMHGRMIDDPDRKYLEFESLRGRIHADLHVIDYDELSVHRLWVPDRTGWAPRQTSPDGETGDSE